MDRVYEPAGKTIERFHLDSKSFVRGIMGPIGSSKSTACVMEIVKRAFEQLPSPDGIKRSRWAIIRNSYPELRSTTIKTWGDWIPDSFGRLTFDSPITHRIKTNTLDIEVLFLALDKPEDIKKLLSLELTGAWVNEAREIPKAVIDALTGRVGRFPSKHQGGATWSGIIMDTNPPDDQSWWYQFSELDTPEGWTFYKQPAGDSPEAENIKNLPDNYYKRLSSGKDESWIKVYVKGEYGYLQEGKPVYPMFRDSIHVAHAPIPPVMEIPLIIGADFGLTPAAVICQKLVDGRWLVLDEFVTDNMGIKRFAEALKSYVSLNYPHHEVQIGFGDPAGIQRSFSDEMTAFTIMENETGWEWKQAPTNDIDVRLEVVRNALNRMIDGHPGILVSPAAKTLRKGFNGGYHYKLSKSNNGAVTSETPSKNAHSHVHDSLQYVLMGGGEVDVLLNKKRMPKVKSFVCKGVNDYSPI